MFVILAGAGYKAHTGQLTFVNPNFTGAFLIVNASIVKPKVLKAVSYIGLKLNNS